MSSTLSRIPPEQRRHLAATLGLFSVLFVAVGSVAATGASTPFLKAFVVIAIVVALFLALLTWGVGASVRQDLAEQRLDAAVEEVLAGSPARHCDCGHDHDPDEMHIVDEPRVDAEPDAGQVCSHDGSGEQCAHSCETCVLAALRPSPIRQREDELTRPRPKPRPASERRPAPAPR